MLENCDVCSKMTSPLILSDNLRLIVGLREYIYSHRELFLSPAPVSVYGIKGPIAIDTLLKLWEQGNGWLCFKCDECGEDACVYSFAGNPMTGTTSVGYQCCHCGASSIIAKTKCAKSENETSKTSLFSLPNSLHFFPMFERLERIRQLSRK